MEGVEILASNEVAIVWEGWNWPGFWTIFGIVLMTSFLGGIIAALIEQSFGFGLCLFFISLLMNTMLLGIPSGCTAVEPIAYETHYKVTIDDSVSMNEFLDKYEVLDQEGKIYTVRERE